MKNKQIILNVLLLSGLCLTGAQAQESVNTSGGNASSGSGSVSYSIGQVVYTTNTSASGTLTQGVQQPFEIITLGADDVPQIQLTAMVYPNPTVQNLTLSILEFDLTEVEYSLFDMQGKIISNGKVTQTETEIEMSLLASANYFLRVSKAGTELKTFKIIKN